MIPKIIFCEDFFKLWQQRKAKLLYVSVIRAETLWGNEDLIHYDTGFRNHQGKEEYSILPKTGLLIELVFLGEREIPFISFRHFTDENLRFYQFNVGRKFEIKIEKIRIPSRKIHGLMN